MKEYEQKLKEFTKESDYFIGIDSDGCVFDSMELKHKECFCPAFVNVLGLQGISKAAREVWDFVNLYSRNRGVNRFLALTMALDLLKNRKDVIGRGVKLPELSGLREWTAREPKLGMGALLEEIKKNPHPDLLLAKEWSEEVNKNVAHIVRGVIPFEYVKKVLDKVGDKADIMVVSQTPVHNIELEWKEHDLYPYVQEIAGQEMGTKSMHLEIAACDKYEADHILMLGDAPGDFLAAKENGVLFFPILPGSEDQSWKELYERGLGRFYSGTFKGTYQDELVEKFYEALPEVPDWD